MKTLTKVILVFFISFYSCSHSQQHANYLTISEIKQIRLNEKVSMGQLLSTTATPQGDISKLKALMGFDITLKKKGKYDLLFENKTKGIEFEYRRDESIKHYVFFGFMIKSSAVSFTIKGKTIRVGDHISILGKVVKDTDLVDIEAVYFILRTTGEDEEYKHDSSSWGIAYDKKTKKIISIGYSIFPH